MSFVRSLDRIDQGTQSELGGKSAGLAQLLAAGLPVPPAFAVTTQAYQHFMTQTGMQCRLHELIHPLDPRDLAVLHATGERAMDMVTSATVPPRLRASITEAYLDLSAGRDLPVAVRSSATAEDLSAASFAGQYDSFLGVLGAERVVDKVRQCWASMFTPRAISYRIQHGIPHRDVSMGVTVQELVDARVAGVMFTLNPLDGDRSKVVIEASWGLGTAVVSGERNPDRFVVDKVISEIDQANTADKPVEWVYDRTRGEVLQRAVDDQRRSRPCLEEHELLELTRLARSIELICQRPQDIEWAIDRATAFPASLRILQSRPETVWSRTSPEPKLDVDVGSWAQGIGAAMLAARKPRP